MSSNPSLDKDRSKDVQFRFGGVLKRREIYDYCRCLIEIFDHAADPTAAQAAAARQKKQEKLKAAKLLRDK